MIHQNNLGFYFGFYLPNCPNIYAVAIFPNYFSRVAVSNHPAYESTRCYERDASAVASGCRVEACTVQKIIISINQRAHE